MAWLRLHLHGNEQCFRNLHGRLADDTADEEMQDDYPRAAVDAATYFQDSEVVVGHSMPTELTPGEKFNQKIPPVYDGEMPFLPTKNYFVIVVVLQLWKQTEEHPYCCMPLLDTQ